MLNRLGLWPLGRRHVESHAPLFDPPEVAVATCRSAPAYHVEAQPFASASAPIEQRADQIKRAGARSGWIMNDGGPGQIRGKLNVKNYQVVVVVSFTPQTYSINIDPSTTSYDGDNVKKRFNVYVKNLEQAIYRQSSASASN